MRSQRGFTLLEMMTVVAIIGILSVLFISLSARTFGANADSVADEVSSQLSFAHTRAVQTRRWHCVEIKNVPTPAPPHQLVILYQANTVGMPTPTHACPDPLSWQRVQDLNIPTGTSIWDVQNATHPGTGNAVVQNAALDSTSLQFKPDGTAVTGVTVFISDNTGARKDRIIVYNMSGDVYARKQW